MKIAAKNILCRFAWALQEKRETIVVSKRELIRADMTEADLLSEIGPSWKLFSGDRKQSVFTRIKVAA